MESWRKTFLKRMEQELHPYVEDSIFLAEEGENPDTLRQLFDVGQEKAAPVVMDMAVFVTEDGRDFLQIFTEMALDVKEEAEVRLLQEANALNLMAPLGAFGYFREEGQLYHKYNQLVEEPQDMEAFVAYMMKVVEALLNIIGSCYERLYGIAREGQ